MGSKAGKLLNLNLSEKTCGILNLTENTLTVFDAGRICALKNYTVNVQEVNTMILGVVDLSKELAEVKNKVKNCVNPENDNMTASEIDKCVEKASFNVKY